MEKSRKKALYAPPRVLSFSLGAVQGFPVLLHVESGEQSEVSAE